MVVNIEWDLTQELSVDNPPLEKARYEVLVRTIATGDQCQGAGCFATADGDEIYPDSIDPCTTPDQPACTIVGRYSRPVDFPTKNFSGDLIDPLLFSFEDFF